MMFKLNDVSAVYFNIDNTELRVFLIGGQVLVFDNNKDIEFSTACCPAEEELRDNWIAKCNKLNK